jgi:hypothetical protein
MTSLRSRLLLSVASLAVSGLAAGIGLAHLRSRPRDTVALVPIDPLAGSETDASRASARSVPGDAGSRAAAPSGSGTRGGTRSVEAPKARSLDPDFDPARRTPMTESVAKRLFPTLALGPKTFEYEPRASYRYRARVRFHCAFAEHPKRGWEVVTNDSGFRNAADVLVERPDLRILVTGDSHTDGVAAVEEGVAARLEAGLAERFSGRRVEVLNAGVGGFSFYNYLGVLERDRSLRPHGFVVVVYGGNDFYDVLPPHFHYRGIRPAPPAEGWPQRIGAAAKTRLPLPAQAFNQLGYFRYRPEDRPFALEGAVTVTRAIARLCREEGIRLLVVYVPPVTDVRPDDVRKESDRLREVFGLETQDLGATDSLADDYLAATRSLGIAVVDLRPAFRASGDRLYWKSDAHLDVHGQALVAEEILHRIVEADPR